MKLNLQPAGRPDNNKSASQHTIAMDNNLFVSGEPTETTHGGEDVNMLKGDGHVVLAKNAGIADGTATTTDNRLSHGANSSSFDAAFLNADEQK